MKTFSAMHSISAANYISLYQRPHSKYWVSNTMTCAWHKRGLARLLYPVLGSTVPVVLAQPYCAALFATTAAESGACPQAMLYVVGLSVVPLAGSVDADQRCPVVARSDPRYFTAAATLPTSSNSIISLQSSCCLRGVLPLAIYSNKYGLFPACHSESLAHHLYLSTSACVTLPGDLDDGAHSLLTNTRSPLHNIRRDCGGCMS